MRAIWKGAVSFGLVSIPVRLFAATEEKDVTFRQVHRSDAGRIRYRRVCTSCGEEVEFADIAKGYELDDGAMVVIDDADLAAMPLSSSRAIDVLQFVPLEQIDPLYFARSYYLEPENDIARKPYALLTQALEASGRVAIVKVALRQRETLAALRVREGVLVLGMMLWPDEVRVPDLPALSDGDPVEVRPQELAMAGMLVESLSGDFDPAAHTDTYREALESLIEAKVAGDEIVAPAAVAGQEGTVVDLVAALRASVDAAKAARKATKATKAG